MKTVDPNSPFRIRWNCLVALSIFYYAISIPLRIAFEPNPLGEAQWIIDLVVDLILLGDVWINLHTAFLKQGEIITSRRQIREHYLKGRGRLDIIAILPIDWILLLSGAAAPWVVVLARSVRLLKLSRFFAYFRSWEAVYSSNPSLVRVIKLLATVTAINHWVGCAWYSVAYYEGFGPETWYAIEGLVGSDLGTQYIRCVYWALTTMTTVGYGDITPETNNETIFTMAVMLMGVSMYAYIIGNIASLIANFDARNTLFKQKMDAINQYMTYRELPGPLRQRVRQYFEYLWSCNKGMDEMEFLKDLSPPLRTEIALYLNREIIEKVPLFNGCEPSFVESLVTRLKPQIIGPDEYIVRKGDVGCDMYFISKGAVAIMNDEERVVSTLADGSFFGEVALLYTERRTASVKALTHCHLYLLSKEDLDELLTFYPEFSEQIHMNARRNYELAKLDLSGSLWRPTPGGSSVVEPPPKA